MSSQSYPEDHPLHGRGAGWITAHAVDAMRSIDAHSPTMSAVYNTADLLALVHELKRMESETERDEVGGREMHKQLKSASDEAEDRRQWLTRAISLSGAPEGSDWAGLLEHVKNLKAGEDTNFALDAARVAKIDKLRQRAESAEAKVAALEGELETSNSRRKSADDNRKQAEEYLKEPCTELRNVVSLLDESTDTGVLYGPATEDGVAHIVNKRLVRDAARIIKLEKQANKDAHQIAGVVDYLAGDKAVEQAGNITKMVDTRIKALESEARTLRIKHDTMAVQRDQALGLRDANGMRTEPELHLAELQKIRGLLERVVSCG